MSKVPRHEWLNSIASAFAVLLALASLGLNLYDRYHTEEERIVVQPSILTGGQELRVDVINAGKREIWLRYVAVRFFDKNDKDVGEQIAVKPPPFQAIRLASREVREFHATYGRRAIPDNAVYAEIAVGTTLSDVPCLLVDADFFRGTPEEYGLVSEIDGVTWRMPRRDQVMLFDEIASARRSPAWGFPLQ